MNQKRPAVFVDRDNTLIHDPGYLRHAEHVRLLPGVGEAVARLRSAGFPVVVVTNQSGVARGYLTEAELATVHQRMQELLQESGSGVDAIYYCPFLTGPDAVVEAYRKESDLRKPKPGMMLQAAEDMNLDLAASWMIGDSDRDVLAGMAVGCRTILIGNGPIPDNVTPDFTAAGFARAADIVIRETTARLAPKPEAGTATENRKSGKKGGASRTHGPLPASPSIPASNAPKSKSESSHNTNGAVAVAAPPAVRVADPHVRILEPAAAASRRNVVEAESSRPPTKPSVRDEVAQSTPPAPAPAPQLADESRPVAEIQQSASVQKPTESADAPNSSMPTPARQQSSLGETLTAASPPAPAEQPRRQETTAPTGASERPAIHTAPEAAPSEAISPAKEATTATPSASPAKDSDQIERLRQNKPPEPTMGQLLEELRMMRREKQSTDFSFAQLGGAIAQAFAVCALAFGLFAAVNGETQSATFRIQLAIAFQLLALTGFIVNRKT
ncbi:MAG: HAD-IIIA family hydrolase [Phycisphaerae bacterium]|nr:HAD-IIIA family hydrolase [Phycisphaerae bacterium]